MFRLTLKSCRYPHLRLFNRLKSKKPSPPAYTNFSPFIEQHGEEDYKLNLAKSFNFYYANPHPQITPFLFLSCIKYNDVVAMALLSHQMRTYPHRITEWCRFLMEGRPKDLPTNEVEKFNSLLGATLLTCEDISLVPPLQAEYTLEHVDNKYRSIISALKINEEEDIKFLHTIEDSLNQYKQFLKLDKQLLENIDFPITFWQIWWGLFHLTGDLSPIQAILSTCSPFMKSQDNPISQLCYKYLVSNAYQHKSIFEYFKQLESSDKGVPDWLGKIIEDTKVLSKKGPYQFSKKPPLLPNSSEPIITSFIPNLFPPASILLPPKPSAIKDNRLQEVQKDAESYYIVSAEGKLNQDIILDTMGTIFDEWMITSIDLKAEEALSPLQHLIFDVLECFAWANRLNTYELIHCLAKLSAVLYMQNHPKAFTTKTNSVNSIKAVYWYKRLIDEQPDEVLLNHELGIVLAKAGEYNQSAFLLNRSLRLGCANSKAPYNFVVKRLQKLN